MALTDTLVEIGDAIRAKDGTVEPIPFLDMPDRILAIPSGGGGDWQPPADWWDVKTMVDTGVLEWSGASVPNVRYGYVVIDLIATTTLPAGYEYYLSDGTHYDLEYTATGVTHTWNRAHDKPCFEGYATRCVIVCKAEGREVAISQRAAALDGITSLYVYLGDCNVTSFVFCGSSVADNANLTIRAIDHNELATIAGNIFSAYAYLGCRGLVYADIPPGATNMGNYQFSSTGLRTLKLPSGVTTLGVQFFYASGGCDHIVLPESLTTLTSQSIAGSGNTTRSIKLLSTNVTTATNSFSGLSSLLAFSVPVGFQSSLNLSYSPNLSVSSLEQLIYNAAQRDPQEAITFTFGAVNLDKLSDDIKLFAVQNGITLA